MKCSTLRPMLLAVTAAAAVTCGCQRVQPPKTQAVVLAVEPVADEASVHRDWDRQTAVLPTGAVVAGSTRMPFTPEPETRDGLRLVEEPVLFAGEVVMIPFTYLFTYPFTPRVYESYRVPPTSTGLPRIPVAPDQSLTGRTDSGKPIPPVTAGLEADDLEPSTAERVPQPAPEPSAGPHAWELP